MKWFFALNEGHAFAEFSKLVQVAVHTAQKYTRLAPHFIYDGADNFLTEWLNARGVTIIKRRSFIYDDLREISERKNDKNILSIGAGAFLRTEIPQLCLDLNIEDDFVLYTDVDVMFRREIIGDLQKLAPKFFAVAPEFDRRDYKQMNSGVMLMNVKNLQREDAKFREFIRQNLETLVAGAWDQTAYKLFYQGKLFGFKWDKLEPELNWKTYWGNFDSAKIVHFHGPKPFFLPRFKGAETEDGLKPLLPLVTEEYAELSRIWDGYYAECLKAD